MGDEDYIVEIVSESNDINCIECPICLNDISDSEFYITMNCCNKNIHTNCLCKWYKNRSKSKNKFKQNCFLCTKMLDDTVKDVINNFIKECETNNSNVNRNLINIDNRHYRDNRNNGNNGNNGNNDCKKVVMQYLLFSSVLIFSFLFFFLILL